MNAIDNNAVPPVPGHLLERIVRAKREEVEARRARMPLAEVRARSADAPPPRDFLSAVAGGTPLAAGTRVRLIAEIKKASPSRGVIREDFDPLAIARAYAAGGADALSVLTDTPFFQGSVEIFESVRRETELPMLRKDFMIAPYQFYEARAMGADAVLLITSILTPGQMAEFHELARALGMAALVETHSERDIRRAMTEIRPLLLGINNRDLDDPSFRADIRHTGRVLPVVRESAGAGPMPAIVSESGIHTADDVALLRDLGVTAILVGESLMRQPDPAEAARALMAKARHPA